MRLTGRIFWRERITRAKNKGGLFLKETRQTVLYYKTGQRPNEENYDKRIMYELL